MTGTAVPRRLLAPVACLLAVASSSRSAQPVRLAADGSSAPSVSAAPTDSPAPSAPNGPNPRRPRIGLVLSGGGARGVAEVGVIKALEEAGIPIDCIAGASMGAIVGGLYAAGVPADSLEKIASRRELFRSPTAFANLSVYQKRVLRPRSFGLYFSGWEYHLPRSLVNDFNINWMLVEHTAPASLLCGDDFDRLPIPFRTLALDLRSGELYAFRHGDLARAIRSSMSVPLAFPPIPASSPDRLLIDPGPKQNVPVALAREMGAERIIAVNCTGSREERFVTTDASTVAFELVRILSEKTDSLAVKGWDVWIEPRTARIGLVQLERPGELVKAGYDAAWAQMERIRGLFPPGTLPVPSQPVRVRALSRQLGDLKVGDVRLTPPPGSYAWVPKTELRLKPGDPFTLERLEKGLRRLYNTGHYESVWPSLTLVNGNQVNIDLALEERAPTYVSVGLQYDNSRDANLDLEILHDNLLRLGETLHGSLFLGSFYDGGEAGIRFSRVRGTPFGADLLARSDRTHYSQDDRGDFVRRKQLVELATALPGGHEGLLLAGFSLVRDQGENGVGVPDWSALDRVLWGTLFLDHTDERILPNEGERIRLHYEVRQSGPSAPLTQSVSGLAALSMPAWRFTFTPQAEVASLDRRNLPFRYWHRLDLSRATLGRFEQDLYAPAVARGSFTLGFRLATNLLVWSTGAAGVRGEAVDDLRTARAAQGLDCGLLQRTPIGPVMLGGSFEEHRSPFLFLQVGHDVPNEP